MANALERKQALVDVIAQDIAALVNTRGDMTQLQTVHKATLVGAINELLTEVNNYALLTEIDNGAAVLNKAWSSQTTKDYVDNAKAGAISTTQSALDAFAASVNSQFSALTGVDNGLITQFQSLFTALQNNNAADLLTQALAMKAVRYDVAQTLNAIEQAQARSNIGATSYNEIYGYYGDPDYDLAARYTNAKTAALV